jgi:hypothetical protein
LTQSAGRQNLADDAPVFYHFCWVFTRTLVEASFQMLQRYAKLTKLGNAIMKRFDNSKNFETFSRISAVTPR